MNSDLLKHISNAGYLTGLIGSPVSHSLSPKIHKAAFDFLAMKDYDYILLDVNKESLESAVNEIKADGRFIGFNVTMPDKIDILNYCDEVSDRVKAIGGANTIKIENGKLLAYNTDGEGFVKAIEDRGLSLKNKKMVILGAGGAARSIKVSCEERQCNCNMLHRPSMDALINELNNADFFVNATPVGMHKVDCPIENLDNVNNNLFVADIIYGNFKTNLIKMAENKGLACMDGRDMLFNQALLSFQIWHGVLPDISRDSF